MNVTDEERLLSLGQAYLSALVDNDPDRVPLAADVRFTENCQTLAIGAGHWRTINCVHGDGQALADPLRGQLAFWVSVLEMEEPAILAVRLGVRDGLIHEIETLVVRKMWLFEPDGLATPDPALHQLVPPCERSSARDLVEIADLYFDGLESDDPSLMRIGSECVRYENGVQTTSNPDAATAENAPWRALSVVEQLRQGSFTHIEAVRDRRYPLLDEARGLVLAHVTFDHPGDIRAPDGSRPFDSRLPFGHPVSDVIYEVFKVRAGVIVGIWCVVAFMPYGTRSTWDRRHAAGADAEQLVRSDT